MTDEEKKRTWAGFVQWSQSYSPKGEWNAHIAGIQHERARCIDIIKRWALLGDRHEKMIEEIERGE